VTFASRRCARPGCRAWARRGGTLCASHERQVRAAAGRSPHAEGGGAAGRPSRSSGDEAGVPTNLERQRLLLEFFAGVFTEEEYQSVRGLVETRNQPLEVEMALIRVLLRRVMERIGEDDPAKAMPMVRQALDVMCRTLRTQHLLSGDAADTITASIATLAEQVSLAMNMGESR